MLEIIAPFGVVANYVKKLLQVKTALKIAVLSQITSQRKYSNWRPKNYQPIEELSPDRSSMSKWKKCFMSRKVFDLQME